MVEEDAIAWFCIDGFPLLVPPIPLVEGIVFLFTTVAVFSEIDGVFGALAPVAP